MNKETAHSSDQGFVYSNLIASMFYNSKQPRGNNTVLFILLYQ